MKKILLSIICFLAGIVSIQAQTLFGTTFLGGDGAGTIIKFIPSTNNLIVAKSFEYSSEYSNSPTGSLPTGSLIQASDGKLYGMTSLGGSGNGVIFSFDPSSSTYTKLKDFDGANGALPIGSLIQASDGKLYGMTQNGGSSNEGVIFSYDPFSSTYTKLKDFDNTNGAFPEGSLTQASNGKLYGMTLRGGSSDAGVIFSFAPSTYTYTKLKDFDVANGAYPRGSLMQARDGKLYGMTEGGGSNGNDGGGYGVIFSFDPSSSIYTKLKDFDFTNGRYPSGSLIEASNGKLYGVTSSGGSKDYNDSRGYGVIFSFDPSSSTLTKLKDFDGTNGSLPQGSLMQASDGKLYGMTSEGGSSNYGVIFSFDPSPSTFTKLQDFNGVNGANGTNNFFGSAFIEVKDNQNEAPTVSLSIPYNIVKYSAPANIFLKAVASDKDGSVTKVQFYNGTALLHTENVTPYGFLWEDVPVGSYILTAKATDNSGNVTTSNTIKVSVINNKAPSVSILLPADDVTYGAPASVFIRATAHDQDGTIKNVAFYNGSALLHTEYVTPYGFLWKDVPMGKYKLTARATDNSGLTATSAVVHVTVANNSTIAMSQDVNKPIADLFNQSLSLKLSPNPVHNTLHISINGRLSKPTELYVLSASGVVLKSIHSLTSNQLPLDVSSLANGVYFIKIFCGDKVMYKQFVKM